MKAWVLHPVAAPAKPAGDAARHRHGRVPLIAGVTAAVAGGLWLGGNAGTSGSSAAFSGDPALALLLQFMGLIKLGVAAGAAALLFWRLRYPMAPTARRLAFFSIWCLAACATVIAQLAYLVPAALLFHLGLATLLMLAWREGRHDARRAQRGE